MILNVCNYKFICNRVSFIFRAFELFCRIIYVFWFGGVTIATASNLFPFKVSQNLLVEIQNKNQYHTIK